MVPGSAPVAAGHTTGQGTYHGHDSTRPAPGLGRSLRIAASVGCLMLLLLMFGDNLIDMLTVDSGVRAAARVYLPWAIGAPLLGVWAFQLDGIFIGATRTADMRNALPEPRPHAGSYNGPTQVTNRMEGVIDDRRTHLDR